MGCLVLQLIFHWSRDITWSALWHVIMWHTTVKDRWRLDGHVHLTQVAIWGWPCHTSWSTPVVLGRSVIHPQTCNTCKATASDILPILHISKALKQSANCESWFLIIWVLLKIWYLQLRYIRNYAYTYVSSSALINTYHSHTHGVWIWSWTMLISQCICAYIYG